MRNALKILLTSGVAIIMLFSGSCHREDGKEESLRISTDAKAINTSVAPDFNFNLKIESAMPKNGVVIEYTVKGESNNTVYYHRQVTSSQKENQLQILNLPRQLMCICDVRVTSWNLSTNVANTTFRVGYK